jgi:hypothetical protein
MDDATPVTPASDRAALDRAANERALAEGARATERDARTAEYDWRETIATPESAPFVVEQADQKHAAAEVSADIAAAHESAASFAVRGYGMDTRQALTAARRRSASPAAQSSATSGITALPRAAAPGRRPVRAGRAAGG